MLDLCKQALGVALLWRDDGLDDGLGDEQNEPQRPSLADAVAGLGRDDLVDLLLAAAAEDGRLADVVLDRAGMLPPPGSADIASLRRSIDLSFDDTPLGPWDTREYRDS